MGLLCSLESSPSTSPAETLEIFIISLPRPSLTMPHVPHRQPARHPKRQGLNRFNRLLSQAFIAVDNGARLRVGASIAQMSLSGFHYRYTTRTADPHSLKHALSFAEERQIVKTLLIHGRNGRFMKRSDLKDAVRALVSTFSEERQKKLRFKDNRPGDNFCRLFEKRHSDCLSFRKPSKQEAKRFLATNADVLTTHLASIERLINEHHIDPKRILNLDESGISAAKDDVKISRSKVYCTRGTRPEPPQAQFSNVNRITILACVHASGETSRPMFVLQGTRMRYRKLRGPGTNESRLQTIGDVLPRGAMVATRQDVAGVDSANFSTWAKQLVLDLSDLTKNDRKVLLTYDGYRSHMSVDTLELFRENNIIAYALPAHTSGSTQPLDVAVFAPWKNNFREMLETFVAGKPVLEQVVDEFDVCELLSKAYTNAFTPENIRSGFRGAGIYPLDEIRLLRHARPLSLEQPDVTVDVDTMCQMFDEKRRLASEELLYKPQVLQSGFIDSTKGVVLTSDAAMELLRQEELVRVQKLETHRRKQALKERAVEDAAENSRVERYKFEEWAMKRRAEMYGESCVLPRPLKMRRLLARQRSRVQHRENWDPDWFEEWQRKKNDSLVSIDQWEVFPDEPSPASSDLDRFRPHILSTE